MELGLSLGDSAKSFDFLENRDAQGQSKSRIKDSGLDFCMRLGVGIEIEEREKDRDNDGEDDDDGDDVSEGDGSDDNREEGETALHLNLLPLAPDLRISPHLQFLPWSSDNGSSENGSSGNMGVAAAKGLDVNKPAAEEASSANSVGSPLLNGHGRGSKRDFGNDVVAEAEKASSRASDDDDNNNRKKLRLSKEQSAFLEESFKEHNTLNPKQKVALAKHLNLRPRQVEVWFQNRRARTKLKQTEVDCEYLKKCCESLTEENRRLHKELQELRTLKTSNPFGMHRPATTLTMCPSCERVATTAAGGKSGAFEASALKGKAFPPNRPKFFPFPQTTPAHPNQPAAS